jgi:hypothetical protein
MLPQGASSRSEEDYAALVTQVALAFNALFVRLLFLLFSRQRKCDTYALLRLVGPLDPFKAGRLQYFSRNESPLQLDPFQFWPCWMPALASA